MDQFDLIVIIQRLFIKFSCVESWVFYEKSKMPKEIDFKDFDRSGLETLFNVVCSLRVIPDIYYSKDSE